MIEAIGHGEVAYGRIESRSGVSGNTLVDALRALVAKGLVRRELPYCVPPGKTTAKYTIADPYLRFWLRFVGPHMAELARGRPDLVVGRIARDWGAYRGRAVEPLIRAALERLLVGDGPLASFGGARHVGAYWNRTHEVEVDLVGGDAPLPTSVGFLGSIKWHERAAHSEREARALAEQRARTGRSRRQAAACLTRRRPEARAGRPLHRRRRSDHRLGSVAGRAGVCWPLWTVDVSVAGRAGVRRALGRERKR